MNGIQHYTRHSRKSVMLKYRFRRMRHEVLEVECVCRPLIMYRKSPTRKRASFVSTTVECGCTPSLKPMRANLPFFTKIVISSTWRPSATLILVHTVPKEEMRCIAAAGTPISDSAWLTSMIHALRERIPMYLVDTYDDDGNAVPSFTVSPDRTDIPITREALAQDVQPACILVSKGCFSMWVGDGHSIDVNITVD